jgi:hypothetical protein
MIVNAERIGNSKKESISLNGSIILKSVDMGKWNYLLISENDKYGCLMESKHRDRHSADSAFEQLRKKGSSRKLLVAGVSR